MRTRTTLAGIAAGIALAQAAPANAADEVVATVAKPTTVSAARGHAVWSAWDPAANGYRLMHYDRTGRILPVQMRPNRVPFDVETSQIAAGSGLATRGFSFDGAVAWFVKTVNDHTFEIHRVTGLRYEPAPPLDIN